MSNKYKHQPSYQQKNEFTKYSIKYKKCAIINFMNNAIVTVVGTDQVGIIAKVSNFLSEKQINIADISQTILSGNFVMMMMVDLSSSSVSIDKLREEMNELGEKLNVEINIMHERVFSAMHRV
jgi:ACT domain-containing protein